MENSVGVLDLLLTVRAEMVATTADMRELKSRITKVAVGNAIVLGHVARLMEAAAVQRVCDDRIVERLERIEAKLGLVERT